MSRCLYFLLKMGDFPKVMLVFVWDDIFIPKKMISSKSSTPNTPANRRLLRQQFETFGCKASPAAQAKGGTGLFIQKK